MGKHIPRFCAFWVSVIVSFGLAPLGQAQVVMNGSFESLTSLPSTTGQWSLATGWASTGSAENHPDVFHIQGQGGGDLPETPVAIVSPFQGMAIAGFVACGIPGTKIGRAHV